jgi:predicted metalloprotease with PDZ domain
MGKRKASAPQPIAVHYRVEVQDLHAHLFAVTLLIAAPAADQQVQLPVWIPGSYLVREFSKHLQDLRARQGRRSVAITQNDKAGWTVHCQAGHALELRYTVYAHDDSVRTAWLDAQRGFFNGTSLCLRVQGQTALPHALEIKAPTVSPAWQLATGLAPHAVNRHGFGTYHAPDYDALVDCPVEMGAFWSGSFVAHGIPHRLVVAGAPASFDGAKLLEDTRAICEAEIAFWHGATGGKKRIPFDHYVFMLNAVADGYGGLEHRNSTALIAARKDLPRLAGRALTPPQHKQPEGYATLLGLISHEYFHTWNVKRLRPAEFMAYDYSQENYTELLWFFEGFTSYYDDLLLRRAQRLDTAGYLKRLAKTINQVRQTPGTKVQSVAQASWDAWIKYYRPDDNTPNATVSYYTKGSLVALCLDLTLRTEGHTTLDAVMRALWARCQGAAMTEADVLAVLEQLGQRSFAAELQRWVHGTQDLPLEPLLERMGLQVHWEPDAIAQQLGLRVKEAQGSVQVQHVLRAGAAEQAGFASGDEWLAVQIGTGARGNTWRIHSLDDLPLYLGTTKTLQAIVARDKRLLTLPLRIPTASQSLRLTVRDSVAVARWLDGSPG